MAKLPSELTTKILCLLPAKSLLRFRCVSKDWASLFAQPYFAKLCAQQQPHDLQLIVRDGHLYSLDCVSLDCAIRLDHLLKDTDFTVKKVLGCSNGLVCLSVSSIFSNSEEATVEFNYDDEVDYDDGDYIEYFCTTDYIDDIIVICNLSTGAHHIVPSEPIIFQEDGSSMGMRCEFHRNFIYGFGFDPSSNDYKLVRISQYIYRDRPLSEYEVCSEINVYSMKTNSWTRVHQDIDKYCIACKEPVLVGGVLYWTAFRRRGRKYRYWFHCEQPNIILAFDIADGVYSFREVTVNFHDGFPALCLGSMRGRLFVMSRQLRILFHLMEEYGDNNSSWNLMACLLCNVELNSEFWFAKSFPGFSYEKALAFSKSGGKVLVEQDKDNFVCLDLTKKTVNKSQVHFISFEQPKKRKLCN